MTTPPLLLHVGFHKTATTWMQRRLFLPENGFRQLMDHQDVWSLIVRPHGLDWDPEPARALIRARAAALEPGEAPVISSEILSGNMFFGGRESEVYAARLREIAPEARILVSIRSQAQMLRSVYMQYVRRGGALPPAAFFAPADELGYFAADLAHFEFDRLTGRYQSLFGAERVHIVTQEAIAKDMGAAAAAIAAFAGAGRFAGLAPAAAGAEGAAPPEFAAPLLRRVNHVRRSPLNPAPMVPLGAVGELLYRAVGWLARRKAAAALFGARRPVADEARRHLDRYRESNRRLAAMARNPLDLSGYP